MADSKFKFKPIHLIIIGLTIIVLGVLIPSYFVSVLSTIGLAVIIGLLILLSAYVFFAVNLVRLKGKKTIKWLVLPVILCLLMAGGFYASIKYNEHLEDKVYTAKEKVKLPGFMFKVTDVTEEPLPFSTKDIDPGLIECDSVKYGADLSGAVPVFDTSNPHKFWLKAHCNNYNNDRKDILEQAKEYEDTYDSRMIIKYEVAANDTVRGKDLSLELLPDSGRKVNLRAETDASDRQYSFMRSLGVEGYVANPASDFGGDLSKGLTRKGYIGLDLKKTEQVVDVIIKYHDATRLIRIGR